MKTLKSIVGKVFKGLWSIFYHLLIMLGLDLPYSLPFDFLDDWIMKGRKPKINKLKKSKRKGKVKEKNDDKS